MAISKKLRFEIFKRDNFSCQYCGKTPPQVTLEIDHINPKKLKGDDDINNLITACFDCNRGKKHIPLKTVPNTIQTNMEILREREIQISEYNKLLRKIVRRENTTIEEICSVYNSYFKGWQYSDNFKEATLRRFAKQLPKESILEALHIACQKYDQDRSIKYFCGICWNKIKGVKQPWQE